MLDFIFGSAIGEKAQQSTATKGEATTSGKANRKVVIFCSSSLKEKESACPDLTAQADVLPLTEMEKLREWVSITVTDHGSSRLGGVFPDILAVTASIRYS